MSDKVAQQVFLPQSMLKSIADEATRMDVSLSWCAQRAWSLSRTKFKKAEELEGGNVKMRAMYAAAELKTKQTLFFPPQMLEEIRAEAFALDRSLSWVMQMAWYLSETQISTLTHTR